MTVSQGGTNPSLSHILKTGVTLVLCNHSLVVLETFTGTEKSEALPHNSRLCLSFEWCLSSHNTWPGLLHNTIPGGQHVLPPIASHCCHKTLVPFGLVLWQCLPTVWSFQQRAHSAQCIPWGPSKCNFRAKNEVINVTGFRLSNLLSKLHLQNFRALICRSSAKQGRWKTRRH